MLRSLAGKLAVFLLNLLGRLPITVTMALGTLLLPLYLPFRRSTRAKLRRLDPPVGPLAYYRMRLRLALLSLRQTLRLSDGCALIVEGSGLYEAALASGKPVALLGWHQGPVELLHRVPSAARPASGSGRRSFLVMTASAFSPALAEWMARGRTASGAAVIRPHEAGALRGWIREKGVLAVMIDQLPGEPGDRLRLRNGRIRLPWPRRLTDWMAEANPECLAVSARWEPGNRIVFRYHRINAASLKDDLGRLMEEALSRAPEQYNWSYPKMSVERGASSL